MHNKKIISILIVVSLIMILFVSSASAACYGGATIKGSSVNIRSGPSTDYSVVATVNSGDTVIITGNQNGYHKVIYNGKEGWVNDSYITLTNSVSGNYGTAYVNGSNVNVRSSADASSSIITTLNSGTAVSVTGVTGNWYNISTSDGTTGYINGSYIKWNSSSSTATTTTTTSGNSYTAYVKGTNVRMRSGPATSYSIIAEYNAGKQVTVTGTDGNWTAVTVDGQSGYISSAYITSTSSSSASSNTAYIKGTKVRFRSGPSTSSDVIGEYSTGQKVTVTGTSGSWTACTIDGKSGYVSSVYITTTDPGTATSTEGTTIGQKIANTACEYVGYPYVYGGTDPSGFDCSGFVQYIYGLYGYKLDRTAEQQAGDGYAVSSSQLQAGDIICFSYGSGYIGHVGIYIGNGKFVHAQNSSTGVVITDLWSSSYADRIAACRRIVQ